MKSEERNMEELCIPIYVVERVENCIKSFDVSEEDVNRAWRELKRDYHDISEGKYEKTMEELYEDECRIVAYLRYYFFLNYPSIKWILLRNREKGIFPKRKRVKMLDFGAGPGTASMAVCDFLKDEEIYVDTKIELHFDDKNGLFCECYRRMLEGHEKVERIKYAGEAGYRKDAYDTVIISCVLSELDEYSREWLSKNVCKWIKKGGYLVIIEPAYKYDVRSSVGGFFKELRRCFKIVDASGPLCSNPDCELHGKCRDMGIMRKKLRTPEAMTEEMKRFFEERKEGMIRWVYAVLKKVNEQESVNEFADPSDLKCRRKGENVRLCGWVIEKSSTENAENMTICGGSGRCNLAFWRNSAVFESAEAVSEGNMLCVRGELLGIPFRDLSSVSVTEIVEHIKRIA